MTALQTTKSKPRLLTLSDLCNGFGAGDFNNGPLVPLETEPPDTVYLRVVAATPVQSRRDLEIVNLFSHADSHGKPVATLAQLIIFTSGFDKIITIVSKMSRTQAQLVQRDHRRGLHPELLSIEEVEWSADQIEQPCFDDSLSDMFKLSVSHDTAPIMKRVLDGIVGAIGEPYLLTSSSTTNGGAVMSFRTPVKSPEVLAWVKNAVDRLCTLMEREHPEMGFTATLMWREASGTILRRVYPRLSAQ